MSPTNVNQKLADREFFRVASTFLDEALREENALRESNQRFRDAFMSSPIGFAIVDLDGSWIEVNKSLCDSIGYSRKELLSGMTFADITHPDDIGKDEDLYRSLRSGEISWYKMAKRYIHKDGHTVPVVLSVSAGNDPSNGRVVYAVSQIIDMDWLVDEAARVSDALRDGVWLEETCRVG